MNEKTTLNYATMDDHLGMDRPAYPGDVGVNLKSAERVVIEAGTYGEIFTPFRAKYPAQKFGLVLPRSGANRSGKLVVLPGVIDTGYTGKLGVFVHNLARPSLTDVVGKVLRRLGIETTMGKNVVIVEKGQSLAQLVLLHAVYPKPVLVDMAVVDGVAAARGTNGFGSSGK